MLAPTVEDVMRYRASQKLKIDRTVAHLLRVTMNGRNPIPDVAASEIMFQIHTWHVTLLEYDQAFVRDWNILEEDKSYVAETVKRIFAILEAANGVIKAREMRLSLEAKTRREQQEVLL